MRVRSACPVRGVLSVGAAVFVMGCGLESVELERIDGGGRATLRLPNDASGGL